MFYSLCLGLICVLDTTIIVNPKAWAHVHHVLLFLAVRCMCKIVQLLAERYWLKDWLGWLFFEIQAFGFCKESIVSVVSVLCACVNHLSQVSPLTAGSFGSTPGGATAAFSVVTPPLSARRWRHISRASTGAQGPKLTTRVSLMLSLVLDSFPVTMS